MQLPKAEQQKRHWQTAAKVVLMAAEAQGREGSSDRKMKKPGSARRCIGNRKAGTCVMEFNCSRAPCCSQGLNRSDPFFRAFHNFARNVPASLMFLVADR
jgi:hypothetical protein